MAKIPLLHRDVFKRDYKIGDRVLVRSVFGTDPSRPGSVVELHEDSCGVRLDVSGGVSLYYFGEMKPLHNGLETMLKVAFGE